MSFTIIQDITIMSIEGGTMYLPSLTTEERFDTSTGRSRGKWSRLDQLAYYYSVEKFFNSYVPSFTTLGYRCSLNSSENEKECSLIRSLLGKKENSVKELVKLGIDTSAIQLIMASTPV